MKCSTEQIIGHLILKGFIPRDACLELIDFFHRDIDSYNPKYNWSIYLDTETNKVQISDSLGWIPFDKVVTTQEDLNKAIEIYFAQIK